MNIRDYSPAEGMAFQGDVAIIPVPVGIEISTLDEIEPVAGRLILQEGEITGHHHAITLDGGNGRSSNFRAETRMADVADAFSGASPDLRRRLSGKARTEKKVAGVHLYRDQSASQLMVSAGILDRADLCVGFLVVDGNTTVVKHEEHDSLRLPEGRYYIGRQIESAGAEERRVQD